MGIIKLIATAAFTYILSTSLFSQNSDLDEYFDDGNLNNSKNDIKFNITSIINGDWSISYERKFNWFSGELSFGLTRPYYIFDPMFRDQYYNFINDSKGGTSYSIFPKVNFKKKETYHYYMGLRYRHRRYKLTSTTTLKDDHFKINDYLFQNGVRMLIGKRAVIDYSIGIGLSFDNSTDFGLSGLAYPLDIKLGIPF